MRWRGLARPAVHRRAIARLPCVPQNGSRLRVVLTSGHPVSCSSCSGEPVAPAPEGASLTGPRPGCTSCRLPGCPALPVRVPVPSHLPIARRVLRVGPGPLSRRPPAGSGCPVLRCGSCLPLRFFVPGNEAMCSASQRGAQPLRHKDFRGISSPTGCPQDTRGCPLSDAVFHRCPHSSVHNLWTPGPCDVGVRRRYGGGARRVRGGRRGRAARAPGRPPGHRRGPRRAGADRSSRPRCRRARWAGRRSPARSSPAPG